ncbi:hypothetical protein SAMD00023353_2100470 [Rosellinia necatrix]|uniref:Uncharacterized protein n=1 Tax=Rosellinia necatrix TaxID=77044 RepID=A0A1W2TFJ8_ROSNE|nr:hypothetical protein SAMD00023353_2100470 [Rosellinia necatrix]
MSSRLPKGLGPCKPHPEHSNTFVDKNNQLTTSAWIVVTDNEPDIDLRSRICLPRRICFSVAKPVSPIAEAALCTASCAFTIGGKLYLITGAVLATTSTTFGVSWMGAEWRGDGPSAAVPTDTRLSIKKSIRLGRVACYDTNVAWAIIEVADTFEACRDRRCRDCATFVNNCWDTENQRGSVPVDLIAMKKPARRNGEPNLLSRHSFRLRCAADNRETAGFRHVSWHKGAMPSSGGSDRLNPIDSGSLVMYNGQDIGIATAVEPDRSQITVLLFNYKLWAFIGDYLGVSPEDGPVVVYRTLRHLELAT